MNAKTDRQTDRQLNERCQEMRKTQDIETLQEILRNYNTYHICMQYGKLNCDI